MELAKDKLVKNWFFFIIIFLSFLIDRITKIYTIDFFLDYNSNVYYFNNYINFVLIWNDGMAFGLFGTEGIYYHILSFVIFLIILFLLYPLILAKPYEKFAYSLVIGGGAGNLYDRVVFKAVPDFIDLHYLDFHWFVFNVSDILITFGIVMLLLKSLLSKKNV